MKTACSSIAVERRLLSVRDIRHLGLLLDDGLDGRQFVVLGGDRPVFHVSLDSDGVFAIRRADIDDAEVHRSLASDLWRHTLGHALVGGALAAAATW